MKINNQKLDNAIGLALQKPVYHLVKCSEFNGKIHVVHSMQVQQKKHTLIIASVCGKNVSGFYRTSCYQESDRNAEVELDTFCTHCLSSLGIVEKKKPITVTHITHDFCKEWQEAVNLMEALGMKNTTTDITANNGHLRFEHTTGEIYGLHTDGRYTRRPYKDSSVCDPLNRQKNKKRILERDLRVQAALIATRILNKKNS